MAKVDVVNLNGEKVGSLDLADAIFAPDQVTKPSLGGREALCASLRQGTHKTKSRTEVAGSGKKLWKQKGTAGLVSGRCGRLCGVTDTPCTDSAAQLRLRASPQEAAGRAALGAGLQARDGKLTVVDTLEIKEAKTKLYRAALDKLNVTRTALLVENGRR